MAFFSGWLGYGSSLNVMELVEPVDGAYARRPIAYAPFDGGTATDVSAGSIGPATVAWTDLSFAGLFDAENAGNLLAIIPFSPPKTVRAGMTLTDARRFSFTLSFAGAGSAPSTCSWLAGAELGRTAAGSPVVAGCNVQLSAGVLAALANPTQSLSLSSLPSISPATGSGQLWNNGGVICIA